MRRYSLPLRSRRETMTCSGMPERSHPISLRCDAVPGQRFPCEARKSPQKGRTQRLVNASGVEELAVTGWECATFALEGFL
jgi:hypothetical protein